MLERLNKRKYKGITKLVNNPIYLNEHTLYLIYRNVSKNVLPKLLECGSHGTSIDRFQLTG